MIWFIFQPGHLAIPEAYTRAPDLLPHRTDLTIQDTVLSFYLLDTISYDKSGSGHGIVVWGAGLPPSFHSQPRPQGLSSFLPYLQGRGAETLGTRLVPLSAFHF